MQSFSTSGTLAGYLQEELALRHAAELPAILLPLRWFRGSKNLAHFPFAVLPSGRRAREHLLPLRIQAGGLDPPSLIRDQVGPVKKADVGSGRNVDLNRPGLNRLQQMCLPRAVYASDEREVLECRVWKIPE